MTSSAAERDSPTPPESSGRQEVKAAAADIGAGAAAGAVQGAGGGLHGAAIGAARGAAVSAIQNPGVRRAIAISVLGVILILLGPVVGIAAAASAVVASLNTTETQNTERALASSDLQDGLLDAARTHASETGLPVEIITAVLDVAPETDLTGLAAEVERADPSRENRNLRTGAVADSTQLERQIPERGPLHDAAEIVRTVYTSALRATGLPDSQATAVYDTALAWALGAIPELAACTPPAPANPGDGTTVEIGGENFTQSQIATMRTIIGIARAMYPADGLAASRIGLITARVESRFQNYANDGILDGGDPNPGGFGPGDYAHLAYSLQLPHDAIGSDHASLGVFQQQATMGWGDHATSTWASGDHIAVITRLMTPAFTAAKFYTRLQPIDGWQGMDAGAVAQRIQVSAFPDRYAEQIPLADAILGQLYASSPPLTVPAEAGWAGSAPSDGEIDPCSTPAPTGQYTWPVEVTADGMMVGYINSRYGYRQIGGAWKLHEGTDFSGAGLGSDIRSVADGIVTKSNLWTPACGEYVEVLHADGTSTGYLHMTDRYVTVGQTVTAGTPLGPLGGGQPGGCTFGAHLHMYAYDQTGKRVNPETYLAERGLAIPADRYL